MNTPTEQLHPPVMAPGGYTRYKIILGGLGIVVPLLVAVLFYFKGIFRIEGADAYLRMLPAVNAGLNSLTAVALLAGFYFIRQKNVLAHRTAMGTAFALGGLFLLSYVAYHSQVESTHFGGVGAIRTIYFLLLLTHISLAVVTVGLVLFTLYFALTGQYTKHKAIARWTFPVWLYVSVTGVIVYFMISPYYT
ncbi:putative membrane protein [Hymenobacter sp. UYAg731]